jgi:hypothetical protein
MHTHAYTNQLSANPTRPWDAIVAPADEQSLLDLAMGHPVGADIHRRYLGRNEDHPFIDQMSSYYADHENRMRDHAHRIAAHR